VTTVEAVLFAAGHSTGTPCRVGFVGEHLIIQATRAWTLPVATISVATGGFDDDSLQLVGQLDGGAFTVVVADRTAQAQLAETAPPPIAAALRRGRRQVRYHRGKWQAIVVVLGVLAVAMLLGWWRADAVTAWLAAQVPIRREEKLGDLWLKQLQAEGRLRDAGPAVDAVRQIGSRITDGTRYHYRWLVKDDAEINAYAGLGGVVVVHTGLIAEAETPEQLAGVLAHEVQHVEQRHGLQAMIHSAGWAAMLTVALGDVSAITAILIHQAGNLNYSRKLERRADADAIAALARAGIAPTGLAQALEKLRKQQEQLGADFVPALLSSHPATADRVAEVTRLANATSCDCGPLAIDWSAVRNDATDPINESKRPPSTD
jgi:Zn-dependent protease with chaperone function